MSHPPGLWPVPGDGVLARHGGLILLSSLESGQFADVLLDLLEQIAGSGGDGRRFADAVADALEIEAMSGDAAAGDLAGPSVLAFGPSGPGLAVTVCGSAWADVVTAHGVQRIVTGQPGMLLRCLIRSPVSAVRGGLGASGDGEARTDRFSRLDGGTLRAGGLAYYPSAGAYQRVAGTPDQAPSGGQAARPEQAAPQAVAAPVEPSPPAEPFPAEPFPAEPFPAEPFPAEPRRAGALPAEPESGHAVPADPLAAALRAEALQAPAPPGELEAAKRAVPAGPVPAEPPHAEPPHVGALPAAEPWPPVPGAPMPGAERFPTAAVLIPGLPPPADQPGAAPAGAPPLVPRVEAADLAERQATIAPVAGEPFEAVLLGGPGGAELDVARRPPLSKAKDLPPGTSSYSEGLIIQGVYCKNGHFDDPEALFCAVCGISMNQQTLVPRPGSRPPLGVLVLDDGAVFQLDKDYIIGREPSLDASVAAGRARPLRVADDSGIVSRVHARVQLDGWRVLITDLGSANGTRVKLPRQPTDQALLPQVSVVLAAGSQIDLGGRGFRYESHRGR